MEKSSYQGMCEDVISTVDVDTIMEMEAGSNICSVQVPVKVYIVPELKRYETAWYVVVAALIGSHSGHYRLRVHQVQEGQCPIPTVLR
jgi:hypothetical protein